MFAPTRRVSWIIGELADDSDALAVVAVNGYLRYGAGTQSERSGI